MIRQNGYSLRLTPRGGWWARLKTLSADLVRGGRGSVLLAVFLGGVGLIVSLGVVGRSWKIGKVSCVTEEEQGCPAEVTAALEKIIGSWAFTPDFSQIFSSIKVRYGYVRDIYIRERSLKTVVVGIVIDKPVLAVTRGRQGLAVVHWYLLNRDGVIMNESENSPSVPRLYLNGEQWKFVDHKLASPYGIRAIPVLTMVGNSFSGVQAQISDFGDLVVTMESYQVLVSLTKDPSVSAATLQLLLAEPTIQDNKPKAIDLRFQNIILSY